MANKIDNPITTTLFPTWDEFTPLKDSAYLFGTSVEDRSIHPETWESGILDVSFMRVRTGSGESENDLYSCSIEFRGNTRDFQLRGGKELLSYFVSIPCLSFYLDITGLAHSVWAPLLRALLLTQKPVSIVYVEPISYSFSKTPTEAEIFDLSEQGLGIRPIPSFSTFSEPPNREDVVFIPLLGFEGQRFGFLMEEVQPPIQTTFPIIGVPGFRLEYPFHTYLGNRNILRAMRLYTRVRFAIANSASDIFYLLREIAGEYPNHLLKIAPIGTKLHALGAILFALLEPRPVELVYDHPIRKSKRTIGKANILVYHVACLIK